MRRRLAGAVFLLAVCFMAFYPMRVKAEETGQVRIDTNRRYKGMNASFAKGYRPVIKKNTMYLVVPFLAEELAKEEGLLVEVSFEREENSPFYWENYKKTVWQSKKGVYLYKCRIKLKKERVNGQYPLHLIVRPALSEAAQAQDFIVYVEITGQKDSSLKTGSDDMDLDGGIKGRDSADAKEPEEEILHQPKIMLTKNSLQGETLEAASSVNWMLSAKNCSANREIENLKVTLLTESKDLVFEKKSWYFERISAGGEADLSQEVEVGAKALPEPVAVQLQFDYEDAKGTPYQLTESLLVFVHQAQRAELVNFVMPESIYESDTEPVAFQVQNTGLSVLYNAKLQLEGQGLFAQEVFLGTIEAGTAKDGEMQVFAGTLAMGENGDSIDETAEKYGSVTGRVVFSYENEQGEVTRQTQEFLTAIKKPKTVELEIEEETEQTNQWWITAVAAVILALLLVIVWLSIRLGGYRRMRREFYGRKESI